jgi:Patatin-like phospholipase
MSYRLAVTIAGAVSLGSFEAGVLFEVLDALAQHNQASLPATRIYLDVLTGASAGGMTAAITAQTMLYSWPAASDPYDNAFYNAWVAGVDIHGLLPLAANESAGMSIFSSNFVQGVAQNFLLGRYGKSPLPPATPHPALNPAGTISLGLSLSNLNGVDFQRKLLSGGDFNYTRFQDQITFGLGGATDTATAWTPIMHAAVACGAFPFAFRPCDLSRDVADFAAPFLDPWGQSPRNFTYTDGGVFQNQPIGMAKNLVDAIDQHQDSDSRSYLFVSPRAVDPTVSGITASSAVFKMTAGALANAVFNQAGFQDWIEAETVNDTVNLLNLRATQLAGLLKSGALQVSTLQSATALLLPQLLPGTSHLDSARTQLRTQFSTEYVQLSSSFGAATADGWIDAVLLLELAADLHEKDEMYIYSIVTDRKDLAGAGLFSFLGFLDRSFRDHDYDVGRQAAQAFLGGIHHISLDKLPQLIYTPKPVRPIQPTPPGGFTPAAIPPQNREKLYSAFSAAADNVLAQFGISWIARKGIRAFFVDGKIKKMLGY